MNGEEVFRFDHVEQELQFLLAGVPGNMDRGDRIIDDDCASSQQAVDRLANGFFVSGYGM